MQHAEFGLPANQSWFGQSFNFDHFVYFVRDLKFKMITCGTPCRIGCQSSFVAVHCDYPLHGDLGNRNSTSQQ